MLIRDLLRIPSWLKNGFVVAPLIYSLNLLNKAAIIQAIIAFFIFSLSSSALYILNDIIDRKESSYCYSNHAFINSTRIDWNQLFF